ncbi:hypothetical protein IC582_023663 [Cucumis melo]
MQQLLPVAIRGILPKHVRLAIIRLCFFFNAICKKTIDTSHLKGMQEDVVVTLCLLEKYFPPSFFTIMAIEFCSEFIAGVSSIGLNSSVIKKKSNVDRALSASSFIRPSKEQLDQAHLYVIHNVNDVLPYVEQHMESLRKLNSGKAQSKKWIQEEHNRSFSRWLSTWVALALEVPKNSITPSLRWIAHGPSPDVGTYSGYIINGYYYHTKRRDDIRRVQNSGVSITATTMQVSSSKDKNSIMSDMTFYVFIGCCMLSIFVKIAFMFYSLRSKVNKDIHGVINVWLKTWQAKHDLQRYRSTLKWRPIKFNTKNAYRQEEIDEIRIEWATFVSRFVCWMIVFAVVLYGIVEKCSGILVLDLMHCKCLLLVCHGGQDVLFDMCDYIISGYIGGFGVVGLIVLNIVFYMEVYAGILGLLVYIAGELVIRH